VRGMKSVKSSILSSDSTWIWMLEGVNKILESGRIEKP
jgi:hypothetical protein